MTTRAQNFSAKIKILRDYQAKLNSAVSPPPPGSDIANTLKNFSQTLLGFLKDCPGLDPESLGGRSKEYSRLHNTFPNLCYSELYHAVIHLQDVIHSVQSGQSAAYEAMLTILSQLIPFLEVDILETMPYTVASMLPLLPQQLCKTLVDTLTNVMFPLILRWSEDSESYATESLPAILIMVFQYVDKPELHSQMVECLMGLKRDLSRDLMFVIAHGPTETRLPAVTMLFHYWPELLPQSSSILQVLRLSKYKHEPWHPIVCERPECPNKNNKASRSAARLTISPELCLLKDSKSPPFYLCLDCADAIARRDSAQLIHVLGPMKALSPSCELKTCRNASNNRAHATCFSSECAHLSGGRPIRLCDECHMYRHSHSGRQHVTQTPMPEIWDCPVEMQQYMLETIVSLLLEAQAPKVRTYSREKGDEEHWFCMPEDAYADNLSDKDKKILSIYGVILIVEKCKPRENINIEILGRLLAALFHWFDNTKLAEDGKVTGSTKAALSLQEKYRLQDALETVKSEYVTKWLNEVYRLHLEIVLSVLLPHPPDYARVGGYWNLCGSRTDIIQEGLDRLLSLVQYDCIITFDVWNYTMPFWLEAIRTEVSEEELSRLSPVMRKLYDLHSGPFPCMASKLFNFASERFDQTAVAVQDQVLSWLRILTDLRVPIQILELLPMFKRGVESALNPLPIIPDEDRDVNTRDEAAGSSAETGSIDAGVPPAPVSTGTGGYRALPCFIEMLRISLQHLVDEKDLATVLHSPPSKGLDLSNETSKQLMLLLRLMLSVNWDGQHSCKSDSAAVDCQFCCECRQWHQFASCVLKYIAPAKAPRLPVRDLPDVGSLDAVSRRASKGSQLDSQHEAKSVNDENCLVEEDETKEDEDGEEEQVKHFPDAQLPVHLRLVRALLQELSVHSDIEVTQHILRSLTYICLHCHALYKTQDDQKDFLQHLLKQQFIPAIWKLLKAENSMLGRHLVSLLIHCLALHSGAEVFWNILEREFTSDSWRVRFDAVEKVTVICREMSSDLVKSGYIVVTSLAHAFSNLIGSLDDINTAVAQRAHVYLDTIKLASLKCMISCLEAQFDSVISDRTLILQRIYQLSCSLKDTPVLTWDFFLARFDALSLEAQLDLETRGDILYASDISGNSNRESDAFMRKYNRAKFAVARTDSVRSVSSSAFAKPPYRRACSVPMHLLTKPSKVSAAGQKDAPKDKQYNRQASAPIFSVGRRKSKNALGAIGSFVMPGNHLREYTDEESNLTTMLQRAMDLEGGDRETLHQLVVLMLHFMANLDLSTQNEDRQTKKNQSVVLRHLNTLLGYNQNDKTFSVPPYKLRSLAVFHAFIGGIAAVLDRNFEVGNNVLYIALGVMQFAPSPQRYASDNQPPDYTLCLLEPYTRNQWLTCLLIILYKYQYNSPNYSAIVDVLVRIAINTIDAQVHVCRENNEEPFELPASHAHRPRGSEKMEKKDASTVSIGDIDTIQENDSPPLSPLNESGGMFSKNMTRPSMQYQKRSQTKASDSDLCELAARYASPVIKKRNQRTQRSRTTAFDVQNTSDEAAVSPSHSPGDQVLAPITLAASPVAEEKEPEMVELTLFAGSSSTAAAAPTAGAAATTAAAPIDNRGSSSSRKSSSVESHLASRRQGEPLQFLSHGGADSGARAANSLQQQQQHQQQQSQGSVELKMQEELRAFAESRSSCSKQDPTTGAEHEAPKSEKTISFSTEMPTASSPAGSDSGEANSQQSLSDEGPRRADSRQANLDAMAADPEMAAAAAGAESRPQFRQKKARKTGLSTIEIQKLISNKEDTGRRRPRRVDALSKSQQPTVSSGKKPSFKKVIEPFMVNRCQHCNAVLEQYDEDTISLAIVCLGAFVHREPVMAAPMLMSMFSAVSKIVLHSLYSWKSEQPNVIAPGNMNSVAKQFLRCSYHQLAPNGLFVQLFQTNIEYDGFFKAMVAVLADFQELNSFRPLEMLLESLNERRSLPQGDSLAQLLENVSAYLQCLPTELTATSSWSLLLVHIEAFLRKLATNLATSSGSGAGSGSGGGAGGGTGAGGGGGGGATGGGGGGGAQAGTESIFLIVQSLLKSPAVNNHKSLLEPMGKLVEYLLCNCTVELPSLVELCSACNRVFAKERDRQHMTRTAIFLLVQALKFRCNLPDENFLLLVQFVLMDAGGCVEPSLLAENISKHSKSFSCQVLNTGAAELMRASLTDCVYFIADLHTVHKVKSQKSGLSLHEDTLGAHLKSAVSQYVVLEFSRTRMNEGGRQWAITKYLSWLRHPPATMQQGPREFLDCLEHIRLLSWLLIGAMMHTAITAAADASDSGSLCQPIPLDVSTFVAEHVMVIMTGYAEHSKGSTHIHLAYSNAPHAASHHAGSKKDKSLANHIGSVQQMSALNFAFHLCSLWTMYCETGIDNSSPSNEARQRILEFWGRVTPGILQLLSHAKWLADIVNGHLLHMMESLKACNSTILTKLIALWIPVFFAHTNHLNNNTQIRLQQTINWEPPAPANQDRSLADGMLLKWLKGYVLKLGLNEGQSSQATQIYIT